MEMFHSSSRHPSNVRCQDIRISTSSDRVPSDSPGQRCAEPYRDAKISMGRQSPASLWGPGQEEASLEHPSNPSAWHVRAVRNLGFGGLTGRR